MPTTYDNTKITFDNTSYTFDGGYLITSVVPPWASAWTADSSVITCDTTYFTADGANLSSGGGIQILENAPKENGGLSVTTSSILRIY